MKSHWIYLKYVVRHKWFVWQSGRKLGVPIWQLLIHDWSKFMPGEWNGYRQYFYGEGFLYPFWFAWLRHIHRQPHHWQHWVLQQDDGRSFPLHMPYRFVMEMVADWDGAGAAQGKPGDLPHWYIENLPKIRLHPTTQTDVEGLIARLYPEFVQMRANMEEF